jgi:outer membrane protein OmpA-like peptidoglycan-associated protein
MKTIFLAASMVLSTIIMAQDGLVKVNGRILDAETGEPILVAARIVYEKLPYGDDMGLYSTQQDNSNYEFWLLPNHRYRIEIQAEGYFPFNEQLVVNDLASDGSIDKDFSLASHKKDQIIRMENLVFEQGKADILPSSFSELNTLARMLRDNEDMKVQLEGHTDYRGRPELNMKLSEDRVLAVQDYLISKGIKKKRISVKAYGGTQPLTRENTEEARKKNRRVEVRILEN